MTKLAATLCAAALTAATMASANDYGAPVAPEVTQEAFGAGLNSAATWTAAGVVVVGALIVDNQQSDDTGVSTSTN